MTNWDLSQESKVDSTTKSQLIISIEQNKNYTVISIDTEKHWIKSKIFHDKEYTTHCE